MHARPNLPNQVFTRKRAWLLIEQRVQRALLANHVYFCYTLSSPRVAAASGAKFCKVNNLLSRPSRAPTSFWPGEFLFVILVPSLCPLISFLPLVFSSSSPGAKNFFTGRMISEILTILQLFQECCLSNAYILKCWFCWFF